MPTSSTRGPGTDTPTPPCDYNIPDCPLHPLMPYRGRTDSLPVAATVEVPTTMDRAGRVG